ncbi:hypothetical protein [Idiomarina abyssalis]|uniref:Uncharacterized protein n=1 Tax=Idiomarina abyssalis TaxID=86102 RepID=A0A8I1GDL3_9GAMM|nr:hypothetical protein [Idiomarina abyssalis]MBJ7265514.1 hypothetical protein [Idiomarina abyssalis]MBJ7316812.1 hypothetical protein [Idiomarina abyssalis]
MRTISYFLKSASLFFALCAMDTSINHPAAGFHLGSEEPIASAFLVLSALSALSYYLGKVTQQAGESGLIVAEAKSNESSGSKSGKSLNSRAGEQRV